MLASQVSTFARGDATISSQSSTRRTTSVRRVVEAKESRIGKQPVQVPQGVTYTLKDNHLAVKVRAKTTTGRTMRERLKIFTRRTIARGNRRSVRAVCARLVSDERGGLEVVGFSRLSRARSRRRTDD
jgi:hypothetical protein